MRVAAYKQTQRWPTVAASGRYLGQIVTTTPTATPTPATAAPSGLMLSVEQIISQVNPGHSSPDDALMTTAITGLQLSPAYNTAAECAAATGHGSKAGIVESTIGASTMKVAAATGPAAPFVAIAGAILGLIGAIAAHHEAAVVNEQTILCQAVPATNAALAQVMQDVQSGVYSAAQGAAYLQQILQQFQTAVAPITKSCNEACGLTKELQAIVIAMTQELSQISVSSGGAALSVAGLGGIPTWALLAAAAAAFLFMGD